MVGFGLKDLSYPWSKDVAEYLTEVLKSHLVNKIIPEQWKQSIPSTPSTDISTHFVEQNQLETRSKDVDTVGSSYDEDTKKDVEDLRGAESRARYT